MEKLCNTEQRLQGEVGNEARSQVGSMGDGGPKSKESAQGCIPKGLLGRPDYALGDAGRGWGQEENGMTEDEMAGWHH